MNVTVRGVRRLVANETDFPAHAFTINNGRLKVWEILAIEAWEVKHPETQSANLKRQKTLYGRSFRKRHGLAASRAVPSNDDVKDAES